MLKPNFLMWIKTLRASKKFFFWIIAVIIIVTFLGNLGSKKEDEFLNPFIASGSSEAPATPLESLITSALKDTEGRYGIFIKNLKSGESFFMREEEKFDAGSLYKLKLMVLVFERIKDGRLSESEGFEEDVKELNEYFDIPEEDAELKEGVLNFTVKSALEQTITISHNYSAMALIRKLNAKNLATPVTPKEIGNFFEDLYNGKIIDGDYSRQMLELLSRQKINDRIPNLLPKDIKIAHKTADLGYFEHDGGIVFSPKEDYIFVILSESKIPDAAGRKISEISKAVYEYFNKK